MIRAIVCALTAAVFYAVNTPLSKMLLDHVPATYMAAFLYLGAGLGVGLMYLARLRDEPEADRLGKSDLPYVIGMVALDIAAPIFLMLGIKHGNASNASLLGNFEIAATTVIALLLFGETVTKKLWSAIALITLSSIMLSFDGAGSLSFSYGSLLVLLATVCWGLENNCTRKISEKSTYQIVTVKGLCSGGGAFIIALMSGDALPELKYIAVVLVLGYLSYGLGIFLYIRAQRSLGAAKTSAYYAVTPFIGALLSFLILDENLTAVYLIALIIMLAGTVLVVWDTLTRHHSHSHTHIVTHTHNGITHSHTVRHEHGHDHFFKDDAHTHTHPEHDLITDHK